MSDRPELPRWGLWRMPDNPERGELKWVRNAVCLPRSWRGFIAEFGSFKEASEARAAEQFVRQIEDEAGVLEEPPA